MRTEAKVSERRLFPSVIRELFNNSWCVHTLGRAISHPVNKHSKHLSHDVAARHLLLNVARCCCQLDSSVEIASSPRLIPITFPVNKTPCSLVILVEDSVASSLSSLIACSALSYKEWHSPGSEVEALFFSLSQSGQSFSTKRVRSTQTLMKYGRRLKQRQTGSRARTKAFLPFLSTFEFTPLMVSGWGQPLTCSTVAA